MIIEQVAKLCHQANKAYCESIGDYSQVDWEKAEQWQKDSAINGVVYKINNIDATPEEQHQVWCNDKIKDGWIYGETKDPKKKTHHCLVDYDKLPVEQQIKDYIFVGIIKSLIKFIKI